MDTILRDTEYHEDAAPARFVDISGFLEEPKALRGCRSRPGHGCPFGSVSGVFSCVISVFAGGSGQSKPGSSTLQEYNTKVRHKKCMSYLSTYGVPLHQFISLETNIAEKKDWVGNPIQVRVVRRDKIRWKDYIN